MRRPNCKLEFENRKNAEKKITTTFAEALFLEFTPTPKETRFESTSVKEVSPRLQS